MAFSFFSGKKDKNPPEAAAPVAKAPPTPPKIQNPPSAPTIPAVKPPQPAGLIPATGKHATAATTQPMVMPRATGTGLKPARPGVAQSSRSTQRIVLPSSTPGGKPNPTKPLSVPASTGRINLPIGMILRCLPQEVLASDLSEFEASGAAATEIGLPMNMILSQLPSGKIEVALSDLVPHFPAGYLQPTQSITAYLPNLINLPLMDVVMRIPPDLLALRPDQKDVDAAVINMADPFTEEILREQAEAARRQQAQAAADGDESQAAAVPAAAPKTIAPPLRTASLAPTVGRLPGTAPAGVPPPPPPMPLATKTPTPPLPSSALAAEPIVPSSPSISARTISPSGSGRLPAPTPTRATATIPTRPPIEAAPSFPSTPVKRQTASVPAPPVPPVPRQTSALPVTSLPRQVAVPPQPPRPPIAPPTVPVAAVPEPPPASEDAPAAASPAPEAGADDLQRLAALAMAEMGEEGEPEAQPASVDPESVAATVVLPEEHIPTPEPAAEPVVEPVAEEVAPALAPVEDAVPLPVPEVEPEPEVVPEAEVVPEPVAVEPPLSPPLVEEPTMDVPPEPAPEPPVDIEAEPTPEPVAGAAPEPEPEPPAEPVAVAVPVPAPEPVAVAAPAPEPVAAATPAPAPEPQPEPAAAKAAAPSAGVAFDLNTCTAEELVQNIPGCFPALAESIIRHRTKIGSYKRVEDLLDVPGITKAAYTNLTGEAPPDNRIPLSLNELLGFPADQQTTLKDVTDRIRCWPDVTGCILSQRSGLSLVGNVPAGLSQEAIVAFVPRIFEALNKSFSEITGRETDDLVIPAPGNSFNIFRNGDMYLIILSRMPQMPERHMKVARFVLAALSIRRD
jgi:competence ComEA-like helix-hairpin-helix protein